VVDVAFPSGAGVIPDASSRAKAIQRLRLGDIAFRFLTKTAAIGVLIILGGVLFSLIEGSLPALQAFGIDFLLEQRWNPVTEKFGALAPIYGTLVTSLIAMVIAVPIGLLIAMFLTELCPMWLRRPIGIAIELLAGIPSIIYGIWGLFVFAPFLQQTVQPALIGLFGPVGGSWRRRLSKAHAAAARPGGPVPRTGPDLPRVVGTMRNASKSRNRRASASLTKLGVSVAAFRQPPGRTNARVSGSALAVSRTSRARPIWTR